MTAPANAPAASQGSLNAPPKPTGCKVTQFHHHRPAAHPAKAPASGSSQASRLSHCPSSS